MANVFATKGNLIQSKKSLALSKLGYDLMDRKRNILIREMMLLVDKVKLLRDEITDAYSLGYFYLQQANISSGIITSVVSEIPIEKSVSITYRSVMGVEVVSVIIDKSPLEIKYGLESTNSTVDQAYIQFLKVKELTIVLAEVDNSVYRLANAIRKTQKRANALKNVVIPDFNAIIKNITEVLEEKDREEFSRLKVIKASKEKENESN